MDSLHYLGHNTCDYSKEAYYYYTFATIVSPSTVIWRENDGLEKLRSISALQQQLFNSEKKPAFRVFWLTHRKRARRQYQESSPNKVLKTSGDISGGTCKVSLSATEQHKIDLEETKNTKAYNYYVYYRVAGGGAPRRFKMRGRRSSVV